MQITGGNFFIPKEANLGAFHFNYTPTYLEDGVLQAVYYGLETPYIEDFIDVPLSTPQFL
jgi:hypothetical protein